MLSANVTPKIGQIKIFVIDFAFKTNPWLYRSKDSNTEKILKILRKRIVAE